MFQKVGAQNLTKRLYLKKKAKHDISWYFKNVYPELLDTLPNVDSYAYGGVRICVVLYGVGHGTSFFL